MGNTYQVREEKPVNIIMPLENAMKNDLCFFSNLSLVSEKRIQNLKRGIKIMGVIIHHPTEFTEEMHCILIS